jgi:hypothetical protein
MEKFKEHDVVVLIHDLDEKLKEGTKGTIIYVYDYDYNFIEVEFNVDGEIFLRELTYTDLKKV